MYIHEFLFNFDTIVYQFFETGTSDRCFIRINQLLEILRFHPIPPLIFPLQSLLSSRDTIHYCKLDQEKQFCSVNFLPLPCCINLKVPFNEILCLKFINFYNKSIRCVITNWLNLKQVHIATLFWDLHICLARSHILFIKFIINVGN